MNPHQRIAGLVMALIALALAIWLYPSLPQHIPTHWDAAGKVDGYADKTWGVFLMPLLMLAILGMFELTVRFSPRGFRLDQARHVVGVFALATCGLLSLVFIAQLWAASGHELRMDHFILPAVGILLIIMGNYMGKVPKNFFIGIRTPWTLASDEVWGKTHRLAGILFVLAGSVLLIVAPFSTPPWLLVALVGSTAATVVIYSFFVYMKLEGFREKTSQD